MNVSCPDCQSVFRVDPAKVTSEHLRARCSVCGGIIAVGAATSWADAFADKTERATPVVATRQAHATPRAPAMPAASPAPNERSTPIGNAPVLPGERSATPLGSRRIVDAPPVPVTTPAARVVPEADIPRAPRVADIAAVPAAAVETGSPVAAPISPAASESPAAVPQLPAAPTPVQPIAASSAPVVERPAASPVIATPISALPPIPATRQAPPVAGRPTPPSRDRSAPATPRRLTPIGGNPSYHRGPTRPASPAFGAPLAPPPRTSFPTPVATAPIPAAGEGTDTAAPRRPINPFLANDPNQKARRLARALVSDMIAYHPAKREDGLRNGTLKQLFREEIKKSYEEYVEQIGREFAEATTHFQDALNDVLSGGRKLF